MTNLDDIQLSMLQLQRSALVDTQTIMQILIDKNICDLDTIMDTRSRIEHESEDVQRLNDAILEHGGTIVETPNTSVNSQLNELQKLLSQLVNSKSEP